MAALFFATLQHLNPHIGQRLRQQREMVASFFGAAPLLSSVHTHLRRGSVVLRHAAAAPIVTVAAADVLTRC